MKLVELNGCSLKTIASNFLKKPIQYGSEDQQQLVLWNDKELDLSNGMVGSTGKNNGFPFLDIFGYLKNTHKNPKFGRVRQVPIRELGWEFPGWELSHFAKFGIFMGIL